MRIAIASDTFFPQVNGVANVAFQHARMLADRGHDVLVVVPAARKHQAAIREAGKFRTAFVPSMPAFVYHDQRASLPFSISAWSALKKFKPDVIYTHTPFAVGIMAALYAKSTKTPLVGMHHTFFDHYLKHVKMDHSFGRSFSWKYTVWYYDFCDVVLAPSRALGEGMVARGLSKEMRVFPNPIDTELFRPARPAERAALVYMGRLSYEKNVDDAIRAFAHAHSKHPELILTIVGDGPDRERLETLARELGVEECVAFTGFKHGEDLARTLAEHHAFITASQSENMPLSVLEAMAAGLPVIAVEEKGLAEIVTHGHNGFLSQPGDHTGMGEHISMIINDPALREAMSARARAFAEPSSMESVARALEALTHELCSRKK